MTFKNFSKVQRQFSYGSIFVVILGCILIFQNCGRIILSDKVDDVTSSSSGKAYDFDANDIISTMTDARIKDSNEYNEIIELSADFMTCGNKAGSNTVECVFKKGADEFTSASSTALRVRNYLNSVGVSLNCPTCNDTVSYTVKEVKCTKDPKYPHGAVCTFKR